jgi:hypothetical protein
MAKGGVRIQILGEFNPKGFDEAQKAAEGLSGEMKTLAKTIGGFFAARQVVNFAKGAVDAASDLGESINAVNVTFGDASAGILALGEDAATAVGLSQREFNAFAVQFSGFTQQIAGAGGDIAAVTDDLTTRIADFASVMNMDIPEAAQVFQSALAGETEPIRKFGIDMSAAAVEAHALATGLVSSKSEMTEAIKVQARYSLLMESTNKVAGDFANTSDSLANQQRILAASLDDAKATIGQAMIPTLEGLLSVVKPVLEAFTELPEGLQQTIVLAGAAAVAFKSASTSLQGLGISAKTSNKLVSTLGVTVGVAIVALNEYTTAKNQVAAAADRVKQSLDAETGAVTDNTENLIRQQFATGELGKAMEMLGLDINLATEAVMGNDEAAYEFIATINDADESLVGLGDGFKSLFTSQMQNIDAVRIVRREYQGMHNGFQDAQEETERLAELTEEATVVTNDYGNELNRFTTLVELSASRSDDFEQALFGVNVEVGKGTRKIGGLTFELALLNAELDREELLINLEKALVRADEQMSENTEGSLEFREAQLAAEQAILDFIVASGNIPAQRQTEILLTYRSDGLEAALDVAARIRDAVDAIPSASQLLAGLTDEEFFAGLARYGIDPVAAGVNVPGLQSSTVIGAPPIPSSSVDINGGAGAVPFSNRSISTGKGAAGGNMFVTVNAGVGTDGVAVGRQIVQILNEYSASGGARLVSDLVGG